LNYPPDQPLTSEEKNLIWKFRFCLARAKKSLTKFLKSVSWRDSSEVKQAVEELLPMWTEIDALELLGPGIVDSRVRAFVVKQLSSADVGVAVTGCVTSERYRKCARTCGHGHVPRYYSSYSRWVVFSSSVLTSSFLVDHMVISGAVFADRFISQHITFLEERRTLTDDCTKFPKF
jgi:hypothetical protein